MSRSYRRYPPDFSKLRRRFNWLILGFIGFLFVLFIVSISR